MKLKSRLKQVLDNLGFLLASKKGIRGFKEASGSGARSVSQKLSKTSLVGETVVCGRDNDKEIIFILLIYEIYMAGMGGIGETSLAQHLYNGPGMEGEFDVKAWVRVLDDFDVLRVTRVILEEITRSTDDIEVVYFPKENK